MRACSYFAKYAQRNTDGTQNLSKIVGKAGYILSPMVVVKVDAMHLPAPREVSSRDVPDRPC